MVGRKDQGLDHSGDGRVHALYIRENTGDKMVGHTDRFSDVSSIDCGDSHIAEMDLSRVLFNRDQTKRISEYEPPPPCGVSYGVVRCCFAP